MSIFGKLLKTGFDIVTTPVDVVKDIATLGGVLSDQHKTYTAQKLNKLADDAEEIRDELGKL
jgi:hypothetical protein